MRFQLVLLPFFYASLAGILFYTSLLQSMDLPSITFHVLFVLSTCIAVLLVMSPGVSTKSSLLVVISWALALQLTNSYAFRLPADVLSTQPDPLYLQQLVRSILASGSASGGVGVGPAFEYSFYPVTQVLAATLTLVVNSDPVIVLKLLPSVASSIILLLLFCFYRNFLSEKDAIAATLIAGSCFWFVYFEGQFVQATFGTLFSCVLLLSLTRDTPAWNTLSIVSIVAVASSQLLSGVYLLAILAAAMAYTPKRRTSGHQPPGMMLSSIMLVSCAVVVLTWLLYSALPLTPTLRGAFLEGIFGTPIHFALSGGVEPANPLLTRVVGDVGMLLFAAIITTSFIYLHFRERQHPLVKIIPYAFGSAVLFVAHLSLFSVAYSEIKDLLPRGFWYVYLVAAPLAVFGLTREWSPTRTSWVQLSRKSNATSKPVLRIHAFLSCLVIVLILLSSMYYYYSADRYDNSRPSNASGYTSVVRLPLEEWVSAGTWSSTHIGSGDLYGDKVANVFIGGLGAKYVHQFPTNGSLRDWLLSTDLRGSVLVLRMSMPDEPHYQLLADRNQLSSIMENNNVVYSSADPVILVVLE